MFTKFDESSENHVYWNKAKGWMNSQTQVIAIPETQAAGADVEVSVTLVDVNKDGRTVELTVEAGGVSAKRVIRVPNSKDLLNLETFVLPDVPAGTTEVTLTLKSPDQTGDSAAMIGAAVSYPCESVAP